MQLFRRHKSARPVVISAEADVRRAIHEGIERRTPRSSTFSVISIVPQTVGNEPVIGAEVEAVTRNIADELRSTDSFCRLPDGSYIAVLLDSDDEHARVVSQRLSVNLTVRSTAVRPRKWVVGVAHYPRDADTEAALIEWAQTNVIEDQAA